jgi:hypothetical protein
MLIVKPKTEHEITEYPDLIAEQIQQLLDRRDELEAEIQELEDAGIARAAFRSCRNPHYREDKYLYLIYPTQPDGSRKREYIGNKPEAVQEALARVERFKVHATKSRELRDLESTLRSAGYELSQILERLRRNHPLAPAQDW